MKKSIALIVMVIVVVFVVYSMDYKETGCDSSDGIVRIYLENIVFSKTTSFTKSDFFITSFLSKGAVPIDRVQKITYKRISEESGYLVVTFQNRNLIETEEVGKITTRCWQNVKELSNTAYANKDLEIYE